MKTQQEIEQKFDERFGIFENGIVQDNLFIPPTVKLKDIKSFIRQLRQDDIKSLIEWAEKEKKDSLWVGEDPETEEMKLVEPDQLWGDDMSFAYNLALDNVISYLKSKLKD